MVRYINSLARKIKVNNICIELNQGAILENVGRRTDVVLASSNR